MMPRPPPQAIRYDAKCFCTWRGSSPFFTHCDTAERVYPNSSAALVCDLKYLISVDGFMVLIIHIFAVLSI